MDIRIVSMYRKLKSKRKCLKGKRDPISIIKVAKILELRKLTKTIK
jgi:hypothetical protein